MPDNLDLAITIIAKNSPNIANLIDRLGGPMNLLKAIPDLIAIVRTVNELNKDKPEEAVPMQYGQQAFAEIKAWQKAHNLDDDGILGDDTWRAMKPLLKIKSA